MKYLEDMSDEELLMIAKRESPVELKVFKEWISK